MDAVNRTAFPSGVKLVGNSSAEWVVRRCASPPSAGMTNTSKLPLRSGGTAKRDPRPCRRPPGTGVVVVPHRERGGRAPRRRPLPQIAAVPEHYYATVRRDRGIAEPERALRGSGIPGEG